MIATCVAGASFAAHYPARAFADEAIELHAFSDVVHRGMNLTNGQPALGFTASYDFQAGVFAGIGGHYANGDVSGSALRRSLHGHLGWFKALGKGRALELAISRYEFDDVDDWSYTELRGDWHLSRNLSLTAAWSPEYYGRAEAMNMAATWRPKISERSYFLVSGGAGRLGDDIDETIVWGTVGVGTRVSNFNVELTVSAVDDTTEQVLLTDAQTVALRISYRLR
ncbi:MAG: hypothetical protein AAFY29_10520 [Pseudomonadota bacterium]